MASQYPCGRSWNSGFLFRPFMIKPHLRFLSKIPSHVLHSEPTQKMISKPVAVTFLGSQEKPHRDRQPITQQTPRTLCAPLIHLGKQYDVISPAQFIVIILTNAACIRPSAQFKSLLISSLPLCQDSSPQPTDSDDPQQEKEGIKLCVCTLGSRVVI